MRRLTRAACALTVAAAVAGVAAWRQVPTAAQVALNPVAVDSDDIGGVVSGPRGPEAGVWVIAETPDLGTRFRKIVVTDDRGRFLVPDLPKANYSVWVRGYGLVDSPPTVSAPGRTLALTAVPAPTPRVAAEVYPSNYWLALINVPARSEFPGTGPAGNGIPALMRSHTEWLYYLKIGCIVCHPVGSKATREFPPSLGIFNSSIAAWEHRFKVGQDHSILESNEAGIYAGIRNFGRQRGLQMFADWTDRIAAGEVPDAPPRPQGLERNLVLTMWAWGTPTSFIHDEVTTDRRKPTVNPNGFVYGSDYVHDKIHILDPVRHTTLSSVSLPVRDPRVPSAKPQSMLAPSPYWGDEIIWKDPANPNHLTMDERGRVWLVSRFRMPQDNPDFCKRGSSNRFARYYPLSESQRQVAFYDPRTKQVTLIDTCFDTHHINFAEDADSTAWVSAGTCPKCDDNGVIGWIDTRRYDQTRNDEASQGWCPFILDTNGDGVIGRYTEPSDPFDPALDRRTGGPSYGIVPNPADGSVWFAQPDLPGRIVRLERGSNPPFTCKAEVYEPPFRNPQAPNKMGFTPRGIATERSGVVWTALAGSGHLASFDRRKCRVLNGPAATGQHCPEGWTLYPSPGPRFRGVSEEISTDYHYFNWVDQFDTLGLGRDVPIATGNASSSMLALVNGRWVILRVPYPLGFFARGLDGRIDDARGGWKGRGMFADYGLNAVWHIEGGKGTRGEVVKFQMRPDPLAK